MGTRSFWSRCSGWLWFRKASSCEVISAVSDGVNGGAAGRVVVAVPLTSESTGKSFMAPAVTLVVGLHVWEPAPGLVGGLAKGPADAEARHGLAVMATTSEVRELGLCWTGLVVVESVANAWRVGMLPFASDAFPCA